MPRVERLEQVGRLGPAHLADDDVIWTVPQGVPQQVPDRHVAVGQAPRLEPEAVGPIEPQLQRVYRDDAALGRQEPER